MQEKIVGRLHGMVVAVLCTWLEQNRLILFSERKHCVFCNSCREQYCLLTVYISMKFRLR